MSAALPWSAILAAGALKHGTYTRVGGAGREVNAGADDQGLEPAPSWFVRFELALDSATVVEFEDPLLEVLSVGGLVVHLADVGL